MLLFHTDIRHVHQPLQQLDDSAMCAHLQADRLRQRPAAQRASVLGEHDGVLWYWKPAAFTVYLFGTHCHVMTSVCVLSFFFPPRFPFELYSSRDPELYGEVGLQAVRHVVQTKLPGPWQEASHGGFCLWRATGLTTVLKYIPKVCDSGNI